jgi:hypothetical protein
VSAATHPWPSLAELAGQRVGAAARDRNAAMEVIRQSAVALRDLLQHGVHPDLERAVYLFALLGALEQIEGGAEAADALHLRPSGRVRDETLFARDLRLFVRIGQRLDELIKRGDDRRDKPVAQAQCDIARRSGRSLAHVRKLWSRLGGKKGWQQMRDLWGKID